MMSQPVESVVLSDGRTLIPADVRSEFVLVEGDVLLWEIVEDEVRVFKREEWLEELFSICMKKSRGDFVEVVLSRGHKWMMGYFYSVERYKLTIAKSKCVKGSGKLKYEGFEVVPLSHVEDVYFSTPSNLGSSPPTPQQPTSI